MNGKPGRKGDWNRFVELFLKIENPDQLMVLFDLFLTQSERKMMVDRYLLVKALIEKKLTQREISEKLDLSISKITTGSKAVQALNEADRNFLIEKMNISKLTQD